MSVIIASKLLPPYAGVKLVERPRLLQLLSKAEQLQVAVLTAPAGYGKTILMVQMAEVIQKPLMWYQLDEYDNDPAVFLQYLVAGMQRHFPGFGKEALQIIAQGGLESQLGIIVAMIVKNLTQQSKDGLLIMIDDYHYITEPVVHRFVFELLHQLPSRIQLVMASRFTLPFSLSRLSLRKAVYSIGKDELRYTHQEIGSFFAQRFDELPEILLEAVEKKTDGWPAALRFLDTSHTSIEDFLSNNEIQGVYDYLAAEVFGQQPEPVQEFLLVTSILEVMTPDSCDALRERTNSRQILQFLEKQQLFLIPLAGKEKVYRYHQLFREFLQNRLGSKRQILLQRAALLAKEAGANETAIEYLVAAGFAEDAITIIKQVGQSTLDRGSWQTVARWLEHLPVERVAAEPWLSLYLATVEVRRGRLAAAENWANRAMALFASSENQIELTESRLLAAQILRRRGQYVESLDILEQISLQGTVSLGKQPLAIPLEKALCLMLSGRLSEAEMTLRAAIEITKWNTDGYSMAHLLEGLGDILCLLGYYHKALQVYQQATECSPERILPSYYMQDAISTIYQDWGEFDKAFEYAKRHVAIKENLGLNEALPSAYIQLASIYVDRSEWKLAEEHYNRAIQLIRNNNGESFYLALNLIFLAQCLNLQGRCLEARMKAEEALAEAQSGLVLAVCRSMGSVIFAQTGCIAEGEEMLQKAIHDLEQMKFKKAICHAYAFQAWFYLITGKTTALRQCVNKVLTLAAELNYLQVFLTYRMMFQPILKIGLEDGIEVTFIQHILVRQDEDALVLLLELAAYSDPQVRLRTIAPLTEIGASQAREAVGCLIDDPDSDVRQAARLAAKRLGLTVRMENPMEIVATALHFSTLGSFQVLFRESQVSAVSWRTVKTRDLLAYLLYRGEPVSKEKIIEDLWPDGDTESVAVIFHTTLYNLRKLFHKAGCQNSILYSGKRYQLQPGSFTSDRQQFQEAVAAGLRAEADPEVAKILLEKAVALYRGDYLEELDYAWLLPQQEYLKRSCIEARLWLAKYYLQKQDYIRAEFHLQVVENYDPFAETVHILLMTVYAKQGNRLAVKNQYHRLQEVLKRELGLEPAPETSRLYFSLIR